MFSEDANLQKQVQEIQPIIEKMVVDIVKSKPKDIVRIETYNYNKNFEKKKLDEIHDILASKIWWLHINRFNIRREEGIRATKSSSKKIQRNGANEEKFRFREFKK